MVIEELFKGALDFEKDGLGFILPLRFNKAQMEKLSRFPNCPYLRATAGIILDFYTDSASIVFSYRACREWKTGFTDAPSFDVFENGILRSCISLPDLAGGSVQRVEYPCRENGEKRITVVFPANAVVWIGDWEFGNCRGAEESGEKLLVLGDSIAQGLLANTASNNFPFIISKAFGWELLNQSCGGANFASEALCELSGYTPTRIIVALGTNEMFTGRFSKAEINIENYFSKLNGLYYFTPITVITPIWLDCGDDTQTKELLSQIRVKISKESEKYGFDLVNGEELVPHVSRYYNDNAHPNDLGFAHYASNLICKIMQKI